MMNMQTMFEWAKATETMDINYILPAVLVTPASKYIVITKTSYSLEQIGDIIVIASNDGTSCPYFRCISRVAYRHKAIYWHHLRPYFD